MPTVMTTKEKGRVIGNIIAALRFQAETEKKPFDAGDTFFSLAFKGDAELKNIERLCGI